MNFQGEKKDFAIKSAKDMIHQWQQVCCDISCTRLQRLSCHWLYTVPHSKQCNVGSFCFEVI